MADPAQLSRRERQIMDIIYRLGRASGADVREAMDDAPSYSAVRALLAILVVKGHVKHRREGARYVYEATEPKRRAQRNALRHLVDTFFAGSREDALAALLSLPRGSRDQAELDRLAEQIQRARKGER